MIAPRLRLILLMLLVTVPLATIAGLNQGFTPIAVLLIGFVLIAAFGDLVLGCGRYRDLQLSLPEIVRGFGTSALSWRSERSFRLRITVLCA